MVDHSRQEKAQQRQSKSNTECGAHFDPQTEGLDGLGGDVGLVWAALVKNSRPKVNRIWLVPRPRQMDKPLQLDFVPVSEQVNYRCPV